METLQGSQMQKRVATFLALLICTLGIVCCGGGGGGSTIGPTPDFVLLVQPVTIAAAPGTSITAQIQVQSENGFAGQVSVTISGLPSGVTVSPAGAITVPPGQTQTVTLNVASSAQLASSTLTFQGTSGSLSHSSSATLDIEGESSIAFSIMPIDATLYIGSTLALNIMPEVSTPGASNFTLTYAAPNLPAGVTAAFQPASGSPSTPVTLTLTSSSKTQQSFSTTINVVATRSTDSAQFDGNATIYIYPLPGTLPGNRLPPFAWTSLLPPSAFFDPAHGNYFVALTSMNRVDVISAATQTITKQIPVPSPKRRHHARWLAHPCRHNGTERVLDRYHQLRRRPPGYDANDPGPVRHSADGLSYFKWFCTNRFLARPTFNALLEWNPSTGAIRTRPEEGVGFQGPNTVVSESANGSAVLFGAGSPSAVYLAATDSFISIDTNGVYLPAANPSGTEFALAEGDTTYFYNASGSLIGQTALNIQQRPTGAVFSADGKYLYVVTPGTLPLISVIDATSFALIGQAPAYTTFYPYVTGPYGIDTIESPLAADSTGLILGWVDHGAVFDDAKNIQNFNPSLYFGAPQGFLISTPDEGPVAGSTSTVFTTEDFPLLPDVWFGGTRATSSSFNAANQVQAVSPQAQSVGPVDVKVVEPTGELGILPLGFSYGTTLIPYGTFASPPSGGGTADLFGYGLDADTTRNFSVSVGSTSAGLLSDNLVQTELSIGFPTPMQHAVFSIPAGTQGLQDINVTTSVGQATLPKAIRYITGVSDYSSTDDLTATLYDKNRNQLYIAAHDHVDVFSLGTNAFVTPIPFPSNSGQKKIAGSRSNSRRFETACFQCSGRLRGGRQSR